MVTIATSRKRKGVRGKRGGRVVEKNELRNLRWCISFVFAEKSMWAITG